MKKILCICLLIASILLLMSCNNGWIPETTIDVSDDGYLVVNGEKTEYKVETEDDSNLPTEKNDTIEVVDGYLVVNGIKTKYEIKNDDVITVEGGFLVVNGVKTDYMVATECTHIWETVTTAPTCTVGGYDTMICPLCDKSVKINETDPIAHTYNTSYTIDDNYHWFKCTGCNDSQDKAEHTLDDNGICIACRNAISATPGVIYDISADGTYAEVIGYNGAATKVKIADEYNGLPIKNICQDVFTNNQVIEQIVIPGNITSIGNGTFSGCSGLTSVVIGSGVTTIGSDAFKNCSGLTSVVIPDGVTTIGNGAFYGCSNLASIVIPNSVTTIGDYAFSDCLELTSLTIPEGVITIGEYALYNCRKITSIIIPDSVTTIGYGAFYYCSAITSVTIGDNVTSIGRDAFANCTSLFYNYNYYDNCKYLGNEKNPYLALIKPTNRDYTNYEIHPDTRVIADGAFEDCTRLASIVIPDKVITIGKTAFLRCYQLTSVKISDSVTTIGGGAFTGCEEITSLIIGNSITSIGNGAFFDSYKLKEVNYTGNEEAWAMINIEADNRYLINATIHYNYVPEE